VSSPAIRRLFVTLIVLIWVSGRAAAAEDRAAENRRTISVSGQAEVSAAPDLAIVSVAVETTSPTAAHAVSENATRSAKVAEALKALIGKDDKLTTTRYALEPRYQPIKPGEPGEPRISGYVARNEVQVETRKVDGVGRLIDAANEAGANRISGLQFTLSNRNEQLRAALGKAGSEARAQAESVAAALGVKLKNVFSATTTTAPIPQPRYFEAMGMTAAAARAPTTIEPGAVTVSATLQVTYEIE
jgi:uncharacterized protein YggE